VGGSRGTCGGAEGQRVREEGGKYLLIGGVGGVGGREGGGGMV
jgi:hypothetical protein